MTWSDPFASPATRRRAVRWSFAVVVVLGFGAVATWRVVPVLFDPDRLRETLAAFGPLAPLAFVGLQAVQVVVAPIPGQVLGGIGGYLFGTWAGLLYSMAGVTLGSVVVFLLTARYGRPLVERTFESGVVDRFDAVAADAGPVALFALFLLPTFPDDLLCALAGLSRIRLRTLVPLVVVGRTPSFAVVAYAGDRAAAAEPLAALTAVAAVVLVVAMVRAVRASDAVDAMADLD